MGVVSGFISVMRRSSVDLSILVVLGRSDTRGHKKAASEVGRLACDLVWSCRDQDARAIASAGSG